MNALAIIHGEHRNLSSVLFCLGSLVTDIEKHNVKPDCRVFHAIANYIESFLDQYHHPKEDEYLFPAIARQYPRAQPLIDALEEQHNRGTELLHRVRRKLATYEYVGADAFIPFRDAARDYINFQREHIRKEETELMPLAREHLQVSDWKPIDEAFLAHTDPLFGEARKKEFEILYSTIIRLAPAPHGFAAEWQQQPQ
ncbi:MAG: hemerythrin domain-containing protein [Gammaproteobacteria bacterium]|nr:hemerythrin domain-containing protein [Gammaproteobacteria bacterium]MDH3466330.1 hemerythrin domain-containing protein [Gammaproteobacteria bacterium]